VRSSGTLPNPCVHFRSLKLTARGSFEGEAPGGVEGDKSRESAGRKHEEEREAECQQTFSDAARKPVFTLAFTQEDTRVGSYC
jgi:hypothetical protein